MARKYYIPRTRSGSSMLASVLTQALDNQRRIRNLELDRQLAAGEITPLWHFFCKHPFLCIWLASFPIAFLISCFR